MKKKIKYILLIILVLLILLIVSIYIYLNNQIDFHLNGNDIINLNVNEEYNELGAEAINKLNMDFTNNIIITNNIDNQKLGTYYVTYHLTNNNKKLLRTINVIDNISPELELKNITIYENDKYNIDNFIKSCNDNYDKSCILEYKDNYDYKNSGTYDIKIIASDISGNSTTKNTKLTIKKKEIKLEKKEESNITSKGFTIINNNGIYTINNIIIVNKSYSLPSNYGNGLTKEFNNAFNEMKENAKNEGITIKIVSGYRSYDFQKKIYNNYVKQDGVTIADTYSARAGHSEHQLGLAADFNNASISFKNTKEERWLNNNAYKYGFILRYPESKENETGYTFEPWHYRYVGKELANILYNNGNWLTIEDYFGIASTYK